MLNPSYSSLIKILNEDVGVDQRITSRYSVVIAAAKRARQIVAGADYEDLGASTDKAVSIAVNEIQCGFIRIVPGTVENVEMPHSEHVLQNLPTVIDDGFVSEDINIAEIDDDIIDDDFEDDEDWDEDEDDAGEDEDV